MAASGSCGTSETSVSDLLAREDDRPARPAALDRRVGDWASRDSVHAAQAAAESYSSPSESEGDGAGNPQLLQLRLQVATDRAVRCCRRLLPPVVSCCSASQLFILRGSCLMPS